MAVRPEGANRAGLTGSGPPPIDWQVVGFTPTSSFGRCPEQKPLRRHASQRVRTARLEHEAGERH
jgi:hypothetical protein